MRELFSDRIKKDKGGVCVPADSWRQFTTKCDCYSSQAAADLASSKPIKHQQPTTKTKHVPMQELVDAATTEAVRRLRAGKVSVGMLSKDLRHSVEEIYESPMFVHRKLFSAVIEDLAKLTQKGSKLPAESPDFEAAAAKHLADPSSATARYIVAKKEKKRGRG